MKDVKKQIKDVEFYMSKLEKGLEDIENWIPALDDPDAAKEMEKRIAAHQHNCEETARLFEGLKEEVEELEMSEEKVGQWLDENPQAFDDLEVPGYVADELWRSKILDNNTANALTLGGLFDEITR